MIPKNCHLEDYNYELPESFIAQRPMIPRHNSKLMIYDEGSDAITHDQFFNLHHYLPEKSTLVFNQTKVFPCRLWGQKSSGGKAELFLLSLVGETQKNLWVYPCFIKTSGRKRVGDRFLFSQLAGEIVAVKAEGSFLIGFEKPVTEDFLNEFAALPIPPYIREGESDEQDQSQYQTTYAQELGSVAAPTAGLHFTPEVFSSLEKAGHQKAFVTLHVGAGTFSPVRSDDIRAHHMHKENFKVTKKEWDKIVASSRLMAVGTTSLRTLESLWPERNNYEGDQWRETDIFLYPGKPVHSIAGMITNFHLPKSSLLMLVSALIGREKTLELYEEAKKKNYRFFSYGDAMLILRKENL